MADQSLLGAIMGGFRSPREAFLETIQMRQAVVQQEQQREEARKMQAAVQDYMSAPNPQKLANLQFQFPALKDSLNAYQQTLTDADRKTTLDFANQAFALTRAGRESDVLSLFDEYVTAAENAGQAGVAKAMRDAKRTYEAVPDRTNREALLGSLMGGVGKEGLDLYEKVWSGSATGDKEYDLNVKLFGSEEARKLRLGQQIVKGTSVATGPAGSEFKWRGPALNPYTAADAATMPLQEMEVSTNNAAALDFQAAMGAIKSMGKEGAGAFFKRNNFPVKVTSPQQARQLPSGTTILLPDGTEGVVP